MDSTPVRFTIRAMALVTAAVLLQRYVSLPWRANYVLADVAAVSTVAMNSSNPATRAILAHRNMDQLRGVAPAIRDDANYYMLYAANAKFVNDLDLAAEMYTSALQHADHRPEIYYERGLVYLQMGKVESAVADLARAARFNPYIVEELSGELRQRVAQQAGLK